MEFTLTKKIVFNCFSQNNDKIIEEISIAKNPFENTFLISAQILNNSLLINIVR